MRKPPMTECPYCGSQKGMYSYCTGHKYYSFDGKSDHGWVNESDSLRCCNCGKVVTKRSFYKTQNENNKS